jgi:hypothetical protein
MAVKTFPLRELYEKDNRDSVIRLLESLSHFRCKYNSKELEEFLKNKSLEFEERNLTRTYLVCEDTMDNIQGYFSIGIKSISLEKASNKYKRIIASDDRVNNASVFLIAHIGASKTGKLEKHELLKIAVTYIKYAQNIIGGRAMYLDCDKNNEKLIKYYENFGFTTIGEDEHYKNLIMKI